MAVHHNKPGHLDHAGVVAISWDSYVPTASKAAVKEMLYNLTFQRNTQKQEINLHLEDVGSK